jgi:pantoate--beta-alanine ligase
MQIVRTPGSARAIARTLARPVGLVPTMGALHAGHLALVRRARSENASVVASIFVNPLQFGPSEDYDRYPRTFDADAERLEAAGVDLLYAPEVTRMYPPGFASAITVGEVSRGFEGARRPGHFDGVATVVAKLFHAIEPTSAYFGQKDVQQTAVIRTFVRDLDFPTNIVVAPTVREEDGLALSSRNAYLTAEQRMAAPSLYRAIRAVVDAVAAGERDPARACALGAALVEAPLVLEYLAIVDPQTFVPVREAVGPAVVVAVAAAGATRLLDNASIPGPSGVDPIVTPSRPRARTFSFARPKR